MSRTCDCTEPPGYEHAPGCALRSADKTEDLCTCGKARWKHLLPTQHGACLRFDDGFTGKIVARPDCPCSLCVAFRTPSRVETRERMRALAERIEEMYVGGGSFETTAQELADTVIAYLGGDR